MNLRIVETAPSVEREARSWHVLADGVYIGYIAKYGGPLGNLPAHLTAPVSYRALGLDTILGLGDGPVDVEEEFSEYADAEAWLVDRAYR